MKVSRTVACSGVLNVEIRSIASHVFEGLRDLEELLNAGVWDRVRESAFRWLLYSISQGILDALAALIAELGFRKPGSYAELAKPLVERRIVGESFASDIARVARLRNRLVHVYRKPSLDELLAEAQWLREKAREIISRILSIAESSGIDPEPAGVNRFVEVLKAIGSSDERITAFILFGSRARGDYRDDSDWDIAVVPTKPLDVEDLDEIARRISEGLGIPLDRIDLVDLTKAPNELVYKVLRDGKPVFVRDWSLYRRFVLWEYIRVLDEEEGFTEIYYRRLRSKLK
jgi:predicted nucleotidyltransferase/uncharacterized protein YutE (UPF0331/DUF86 family)